MDQSNPDSQERIDTEATHRLEVKPPQETKTDALAIASLVLGILSIVCLGLLSGIPGIVCGHMGLKSIKNSNGALTGQGIGVAGLILSYLGTLLSLLGLALFALWVLFVGSVFACSN
jgi:hypothetical protein